MAGDFVLAKMRGRLVACKTGSWSFQFHSTLLPRPSQANLGPFFSAHLIRPRCTKSDPLTGPLVPFPPPPARPVRPCFAVVLSAAVAGSFRAAGPPWVRQSVAHPGFGFCDVTLMPVTHSK